MTDHPVDLEPSSGGPFPSAIERDPDSRCKHREESAPAHLDAEASPGADRPRVLLVGWRRRERESLAMWLDQLGLDLEHRDDLPAAIDALSADPPRAVVIPWNLRDAHGRRAVEAMGPAAAEPRPPIIALCRTAKAERAAIAAGVTDTMRRPFDLRSLAQRVWRIVRLAQCDAELLELRKRFEATTLSLARRTTTQGREAFRDGLTGLPTRAAFERAIRGALGAGISSRRTMAVVLLDIDRFRYVNHTLGRHRANTVLQELAQRLARGLSADHLDQNQGAGTITMAARLGGDQFGMLLSRIPPEFDVQGFIHRLREDLLIDFKVDGGDQVHLTTSVGVALAPVDGTSTEELLQRAEFAAGESTEKGGGTVSFYSSVERPLTARLAQLTSLLVNALDRGEMDVHYQPIVDTVSGRIAGAEALLRWHNAELKGVSPAEFVPLAEERGLMIRLGTWVLDRSCAQLRRWLDEGFEPIRVAVNASISQLVQDRFAETVATVIRSHDLDPALVEIEISERGALREDPEVLAQLHELRRLGCRLAIDDFGTGNSAVAYLKRFPFTTLKIDRSFVRGIGNSEEDAVITTAMIAMARQLGLDVIAEGVELPEQQRFLQACGCTELQGFLFSRPVDATRFRDLLGHTFPTSALAESAISHS